MAEVKRRVSASRRREMILEEARRAFLDAGQGVHGVSTREIASRCGIDEALIYRHFGTKNRLYFEAITGPVHDVVSKFAERIDSIGAESAPERQIEREWKLTQEYFVWLLELPPDVLRAVGIVLAGDREVATAFFDQTLNPVLGQIEQLVESEHPRWEHVDFDIPLAVRAALATTLWIVMESSLTDRRIDAPDVARNLADLLFYGMAGRR